MQSRDNYGIQWDKAPVITFVIPYLLTASLFYLFLRYMWDEYMLVALSWSIFQLLGGWYSFNWRGNIKIAILGGLLTATIAALIEVIWKHYY
jgi:hypothetical protein